LCTRSCCRACIRFSSMSLFSSGFKASIFLHMSSRPTISTLFPYTTLFRSPHSTSYFRPASRQGSHRKKSLLAWVQPKVPCRVWKDRQSTRLNSSHVKISYAVFCLKKKIRIQNTEDLRVHSLHGDELIYDGL